MMCPTSMGIFLYRKPLISKLKGNLGHRHPTVHPAVYPSASRPAETRVWKHIHFHREESSFREEGRTSTCGWALDGWVAVLSQRPLVTLPQAGQGQPWISGQVKIKEKKIFLNHSINSELEVLCAHLPKVTPRDWKMGFASPEFLYFSLICLWVW